ncbi:hypothetical protein AOLI_G00053800 [Acnodon oligacanthus]
MTLMHDPDYQPLVFKAIVPGRMTSDRMTSRCIRAKCSWTGDVGEYSIRLIQNIPPSTPLLKPQRPVKPWAKVMERPHHGALSLGLHPCSTAGDGQRNAVQM